MKGTTALGACLFVFLAHTRHVVGQGSIEVWGTNSPEIELYVPAGTDFVQVSKAHSFAVALRYPGAVVAWGSDENGQVSSAPSGEDFVQVVAGGGHCLALRTDGSLAAWGGDAYGQVSGTPSGTGFVQVAAGSAFSMALRADGSIETWGWIADQPFSPLAPPPGNDFVYIGTGGYWHALALHADGTVEIWGVDNAGNMLGTPTEPGFVQVAPVVLDASAALHSDGSLTVWGDDSLGLVSNAPIETGFAQVAGSGYAFVALRDDGSLVSWGRDTYGQVSDTPSGLGFAYVGGGFGTGFLAIRADNVGQAFCFGDGSGTHCPCGGNGLAGQGCANSSGIDGVSMRGLGLASISNDSFRLSITGAPGSVPGLVLRAANTVGGGLGVHAGDGLLCVSGQSFRSQVQFTSSGSAEFSDFHGQPFGASSFGPGASANYQLWYRDTANTCSEQGFNFSNGWSVVWLP